MQRPLLRTNADTAEVYFDEGCHITEWLNDAEDDGLSIARCRVAPGTRTRWHRLTATTERYVILSGRGRVDLGQTQGLEVGPGDIVVIPAEEPQRIHNAGDDDLVFLALCTPRFTLGCYVDLESSLAST